MLINLVRLSTFALLVSAPAVAAEVGGERLRFDFRAGEIANLTYQLDCLGDLEPCSKDVFDKLWRGQLAWNADDDAALGKWVEIRRRYAGRDLGVEVEAPATPYPLPHVVMDHGDKLRIASLQASSLADYQDRLDLVVTAGEAAELSAIAERFAPRFRKWWATAHRGVDRFADASAQLCKRARLVPFAEKVARFYEAALPSPLTVHFALIARPEDASTHTNATVFENWSTVEVIADERPEDRLDVVLHELFHYFFASAPIARHAHLIGEFAASPDPAALAMYSLLDESLATALGNGLVGYAIKPGHFEALLKQPLGLYADDAIDRAAKAILDLVRERVDGGKTLFDEFAPQFLERVTTALGEDRLRPSLALRTLVVAYEDGALAPVRRKLSRMLRAGATHGVTPLDSDDTRAWFTRYPDTSGVLLVRRADLPRLAGWNPILGRDTAQRLATLAKTRKSFLTGIKRNDKASIYVMVADDAAGFDRLIDRLLVLRQPLVGPAED